MTNAVIDCVCNSNFGHLNHFLYRKQLLDSIYKHNYVTKKKGKNPELKTYGNLPENTVSEQFTCC